MANYISDAQSRSAFPDKNVLMCSYIRMDIPYGNKKTNDAKKSELKMMATHAANSLHRSVETDILIRDGSVIAEIIASGHINELLSSQNLKAIGMSQPRLSIADGDIVDGLISYATLRSALLILVKDIKTTTASLAMFTRWVFEAKLGDIQRSESRTGVAGNLLRMLEAFDVARAERIPAQKRNNALGRALFQLEKIEEVTLNIEDRKILSRYVKRELKRIKKISVTATAAMKKTEKENAKEYNERLEQIIALAEKL